MQQRDFLIWGVVLGIILAGVIAKKIKRKKIQKILKRAKAAEKKAALILQKKGYRVVDVQLRERLGMYINENYHESIIKADMLVRKFFRTYIVEVKTGGQASPTIPNVRRQMLEYYLVYKPYGMIFLDMEKEEMKKIRFDYTEGIKKQWVQNGLWLVTGIIIAMVFFIVNV